MLFTGAGLLLQDCKGIFEEESLYSAFKSNKRDNGLKIYYE